MFEKGDSRYQLLNKNLHRTVAIKMSVEKHHEIAEHSYDEFPKHSHESRK
jgi:hypothetical protein